MAPHVRSTHTMILLRSLCIALTSSCVLACAHLPATPAPSREGSVNHEGPPPRPLCVGPRPTGGPTEEAPPQRAEFLPITPRYHSLMRALAEDALRLAPEPGVITDAALLAVSRGSRVIGYEASYRVDTERSEETWWVVFRMDPALRLVSVRHPSPGATLTSACDEPSGGCPRYTSTRRDR